MNFCKQIIHQNLFLYKSSSLQNLMRCKTFDFEIWHVLNFSIRNFQSCEKMALSLTHLKFLIQDMTRCTTNYSKTEYFQKFWPKSSFEKKKNNFLRNNFSKNAQKSQLWRFYGVNWPDKWFFENEISNNFWFSQNSFSHRNLMRFKNLDSSFDAMWIFNLHFDTR